MLSSVRSVQLAALHVQHHVPPRPHCRQQAFLARPFSKRFSQPHMTALALLLRWRRRCRSRLRAMTTAPVREDAPAVEEMQHRGVVVPGRDPFPPPPHVPTTWWQGLHHMVFLATGLGVAVFAPSCLPSWQLVVFMFFYCDFLSALLHRTFDHEDCLDFPVLDFVAYGFQMHHAWPVESTRGVGLYRLFCDTVRIQWAQFVCFLAFSSHSILAAQIIYLKLLFGAYGSQIGHFYAHFPESQKPSVVKLLQSARILLPSKHHALHHRSPYNENLTSVSGLTDIVCNPLLSNSDFQPTLASLILLSAFDNRCIEALWNWLPSFLG
eukprot:TRINITY_DN115134_c0_g1_i1.p1 TRINITY_DN115134_c0_g1~~TRINITY_DN115134_c0_g1_i1.p1  ORF type:complete len:323 (-),score=42.38 TRINITY_DN115134_c0_g1_i1:40-1008(-)